MRRTCPKRTGGWRCASDSRDVTDRSFVFRARGAGEALLAHRMRGFVDSVRRVSRFLRIQARIDRRGRQEPEADYCQYDEHDRKYGAQARAARRFLRCAASGPAGRGRERTRGQRLFRQAIKITMRANGQAGSRRPAAARASNKPMAEGKAFAHMCSFRDPVANAKCVEAHDSRSG